MTNQKNRYTVSTRIHREDSSRPNEVVIVQERRQDADWFEVRRVTIPENYLARVVASLAVASAELGYARRARAASCSRRENPEAVEPTPPVAAIISTSGEVRGFTSPFVDSPRSLFATVRRCGACCSRSMRPAATTRSSASSARGKPSPSARSDGPSHGRSPSQSKTLGRRHERPHSLLRVPGSDCRTGSPSHLERNSDACKSPSLSQRWRRTGDVEGRR